MIQIKKVLYPNRIKKYNYHQIIKFQKSILKETNLKYKYYLIIDFVIEILIDIYVLNLFNQKKSVRKAQFLAIYILNSEFQNIEGSKILKFCMSFMPHYKLIYLHNLSRDKDSKFKKLKILKRKILVICVSFTFSILINYNSLFNVPKSETSDAKFPIINAPIEKINFQSNKFTMNFNINNKKDSRNLNHQNLNKSTLDQIKPFKRYDFDKTKRPKKKIPLSERTGSLSKLEKLDKIKEKKDFEKKQKTSRFELIMKTKLLEDTQLIADLKSDILKDSQIFMTNFVGGYLIKIDKVYIYKIIDKNDYPFADLADSEISTKPEISISKPFFNQI